MRRPSPGTVIATLAVFVAVGGTAVAVDDRTSKVQAHKLELKNGWLKYGGDSLPPRYFKVGDVVYLEGAMYNGTTGVTALRLPSGARPAGEVRFAVPSGPGTYEELVITENGSGIVEDYGDPNGYVGLDGITFRAG